MGLHVANAVGARLGEGRINLHRFVRGAARTKGVRAVNLFGLDVVDATTERVIDRILSNPSPARISFLNAHCANIAARNRAYYDALVTADLLLPDGIGVDVAARLCGARLSENLNGTDFTPRLLARAALMGKSVFLLGAKPGVAEEAAQNLCRDIPGLHIAGCRDGYTGLANEEAAIEAINQSGAEILIVALGVPKQDLWLARNADRLSPRITLGVGAFLDFAAGRVRRAPPVVRRARCEWIWRLAMEPRRMAGRYLLGNASFLARAVAHRLSKTCRREMAHRSLDLALTGMGLLAIWPLLALVALAIRLESPGPVLFKQTRVGKDGTPFTLYKFRSMYRDAEARRAALLATSDREGICFKSATDPRVTRVGRLLRRFSLDELPQLLNVMKGEMALVGPRPALPQEVEAYPERALERLAVKPGLTGMWQVAGRADIGFDKMVDLDVAYVRSRSPMLDLLLVALTARAVLGGRGAY